MWIDYKRAYNSVPHKWIIKCLNLYKIDETTKKFLILTTKTWKTNIYLPTEKGCIATYHLYFTRGIFQGDSLSPLLFCIALIPITNLLKRNNVGYKISETKASNLLYIDDLKYMQKTKKRWKDAVR